MSVEENKLPKRSPFSAQIDLAKFELAPEDEKRLRIGMSGAKPFLKDG